MSELLPVLPDGWPHTGEKRTPTCRAPKRIWWSDERRRRFEQMWRDDVDAEEIADFFEIGKGAVYSKAQQFHLGRRRKRGGGRKATGKAKKTYFKADSTGQRRMTRKKAEASGPKIILEPHDPRFRAGATVFPTTVRPAMRMVRLLKSGHNSRKIGKMVSKGRWKGFPIVTLTLEERATCPRTCREWGTCYGNNMPFADRIFDDGTLERRLWGELAALNAEHAQGFVVRLHVLGDFYSTGYVAFWRQALVDFPALNVFGFTARRPADPIGAALVRLVVDEGARFVIRFSGAGYETHSAEVVDRPEDATGIRCPAETDEKRCCATCALCWQSNHTISFVRH